MASVSVVPGLQQNKVFKIIVLGDSGVGKTCLTYRFCAGEFLARAEATIGVDFRERVVRVSGEDVRLQLWDTAGQERFRKSMVQHYYRNVHAVVIVYDVTKPATFQSVGSWMVEVESHGLCAALRVLVGNKCDCGSPESVGSWMVEVESHGLCAAPRVLVGNKCDCGSPDARVQTSRAQRLADKYGMPLFETSARLDSECDNVESIFLTLAHKLHSRRPLRVASVQEEFRPGEVVTLTRRSVRRAAASPSPAAPAQQPCCK